MAWAAGSGVVRVHTSLLQSSTPQGRLSQQDMNSRLLEDEKIPLVRSDQRINPRT